MSHPPASTRTVGANMLVWNLGKFFPVPCHPGTDLALFFPSVQKRNEQENGVCVETSRVMTSIVITRATLRGGGSTGYSALFRTAAERELLSPSLIHPKLPGTRTQRNALHRKTGAPRPALCDGSWICVAASALGAAASCVKGAESEGRCVRWRGTPCPARVRAQAGPPPCLATGLSL